jgi:hypothetical protein
LFHMSGVGHGWWLERVGVAGGGLIP